MTIILGSSIRYFLSFHIKWLQCNAYKLIAIILSYYWGGAWDRRDLWNKPEPHSKQVAKLGLKIYSFRFQTCSHSLLWLAGHCGGEAVPWGDLGLALMLDPASIRPKQREFLLNSLRDCSALPSALGMLVLGTGTRPALEEYRRCFPLTWGGACPSTLIHPAPSHIIT